VLIEGRLKLDRWEKDGQKHSKLKVVGERLQMLGSREGGRGGRSTAAQSQDDDSEQYMPAGGPPPSDDIPF
jgi:single-strand DNA-binding protein